MVKCTFYNDHCGRMYRNYLSLEHQRQRDHKGYLVEDQKNPNYSCKRFGEKESVAEIVSVQNRKSVGATEQ